MADPSPPPDACAARGCGCTQFNPNLWDRSKCRDCLHSHTGVHSGFVSEGISEFGRGSTAPPSTPNRSPQTSFPSAENASAASSAKASPHRRPPPLQSKKSASRMGESLKGLRKKFSTTREGAAKANPPVSSSKATGQPSVDSSSASSAGARTGAYQQPKAGKADLRRKFASSTASSVHSPGAVSAPRKEVSSPPPKGKTLVTVAGEWNISTCAQLCRGYLTDCGVGEAQLSFHPRVPEKKIAVTERLFGDLIVGGKRGLDSDAACVYEAALPGSGGRARECVVVSPRGLFWKNLTSKEPHFVSWADVVYNSTETDHKRRVRFRVRGQFARASVDFYKGEPAFRAALSTLINDCVSRQLAELPLPEEEAMGEDGNDSGEDKPTRRNLQHAVEGENLTQTSQGAGGSRVGQPSGVKKMGTDNALRAAYGTFSENLPSSGDSLHLRVQFPEGFPLEFKTLVIPNEATTTVRHALALLHANVPTELWDKFFEDRGIDQEHQSSAYGFFISSDRTWLDPDQYLSSYKGLKFLKKVELRLYPADRTEITFGRIAGQPKAGASPVPKRPGRDIHETMTNDSAQDTLAGLNSTEVMAAESSQAVRDTAKGTAAEHSVLQQEVESLRRELGNMQGLLQASVDDLEEAEKVKSKMEKQVDYFKKQMAQLRAENEQLRREVSTLEDSLETQSDQLAEGLQRLSSAQARLSVPQSPAEPAISASSLNLVAAENGAAGEEAAADIGEVAALEGEIDDIFAGFG